MLGAVHEKLVFNRRVDVLATHLAGLIAPGETMLDVGTGDGQIALLTGERAQSGGVEGIDVFTRPETHIPVTVFDGTIIPFADNSFDVVSFVDVLHHTDDPLVLLKEAARVARKAVVLKDHLAENALDHTTLRFMDWVGNAPHGVVLPYNYAAKAEWEGWFAEAGLTTKSFSTQVPLYPFPFSAVFGRGLHFVARLTPAG
ncbi:MAG: methyltransferase domain-containing protein [Pseudomonadota bacterium]